MKHLIFVSMNFRAKKVEMEILFMRKLKVLSLTDCFYEGFKNIEDANITVSVLPSPVASSSPPFSTLFYEGGSFLMHVGT